MGHGERWGAGGRGARRAAAAAVLVSVLAVLGVPAAAEDATPPRAEPGTVETIAGPEFCEGRAQADPGSTAVRGLAVDARATFIDTGPSGSGLVVRVAENGMASALRTGVVDAVPGALAADGDGGFFVASPARIVHLPAAGGGTTIAGDPLGGHDGAASGDGGPAGEARFAAVQSLAVDEAGNVYVADGHDRSPGTVRIRLINRGDQTLTVYPGTAHEVRVAPGHIDTIVGGQGGHGSGDGGPAPAGTVQGGPPGLALAPGRLYVASHVSDAEPATASVRLVNLGDQQLVAHGVRVPAGAIQTVAGGGPAGHSPDGGSARGASLGTIAAIAVASDGNLYVADSDHHRIRRVDPAGALTTFAGAGSTTRGGFNGNDRRATQARLDAPGDIEVAPDGRVYIADQGNSHVRVVDEEGVIRAAPGNGLLQAWTCQDAGDDPTEPLTRTLTGNPSSVATDEGDVVYFVVEGVPQVYKREASGAIAPVMGGLGRTGACPAGDDCPPGEGGPVGTARLVAPAAVATDRRGGLYVLDADDGGRVLLANLGRRPLSAHGQTLAPGTVATVAVDVFTASGKPTLAADDKGNLFIADSRQVRRLDPTGALATLVAGIDLGDRDPGTLLRHEVERLAPPGCCVAPTGLAAEGDSLYVSDGFSSKVWLLNLGDQAVSAYGLRVTAGSATVVAGSGTRGFAGDGASALDAQLTTPDALSVDGDGNLYIADREEHTVRRVDPEGIITTVVGTGSPGFNGDRLKAGLTALNSPQGLAVDSCRNLVVADGANQRLRRWNIAGPCATPGGDGETDGRADVGPPALVGLMSLGLLTSLLVAVPVVHQRRRRRQMSGQGPLGDATSEAG